MTKRYAQFLPDTVKQASDRAAELLGALEGLENKDVNEAAGSGQ